jgi:hypothetical protein
MSMSENKFRVGDRVRLERPDEGDILKGLPYGSTGRILEDDDAPYVEWDNWSRGHNGGDPVVENASWAMNEGQMELIP